MLGSLGQQTLLPLVPGLHCFQYLVTFQYGNMEGEAYIVDLRLICWHKFQKNR